MPWGKWQYYQEWNHALFLHWQVDAGDLTPFLPKGIELDLHQGGAWVSMVAFRMERIRPRLLPAVPFISFFDELNIRTYVRYGQKTGVYFLSIEAGSWLSCMVANTLSGLPYRFAAMKSGAEMFSSANPEDGSSLDVKFEIGGEVSTKDKVDRFLTERYALFQDSGNRINQYEIHHIEWPLMEVRLTSLKIDYPGFGGLFSGKPDRLHYSPGVQVLAWPREIHPIS